MWLRATSSTKASSTRLALRYISRPARNTARTRPKMVASYSCCGLNEPRKRLPISATSSSPKRQLNGIAREPHGLAGYMMRVADVAGWASFGPDRSKRCRGHEQVAVHRGLAEFRGGRPVLFLAREP